MLQHLLDLYEIQKIDLGIRDLQKRVDEIPVQLRTLQQAAAALDDQIEKLTVERDALNKELSDLDVVAQAENQKVRKWEARLNEIRNQREYLALSREVEGAKRANRDADEKLVALKAKRVELDKKMAEMSGQIEERKAAVTAERDKVEGQLTEAKAKVDAETARRTQLVPKVPKPLLSKYDSIRQKRMGVGVSPVVGGNCQGCNMKVPPQLFITLQRGQSIEQCPSCQRIIFWDNFLAKEKAAESAEAAT